MTSERQRILLEISNIVQAAVEVLPDDTPPTLQTWMNRSVGLLLWVAQFLDGDVDLATILEELNA